METLRGKENMDNIRAVLATIPQEQYVDAYTDNRGKNGYRNPVRPVIAEGLTAIVKRLGLKNGVELGTALGSSGLRMALGGLETLDTNEFDPEAAATARENFAAAGLPGFRVHNMDSQQFTDSWSGPIDLLFVDHAKERYLEDFQALEPYLTENALVLMDNTFNRATECKDAVAYVADGYYSSIFTEPSTGGETTGLLVASHSREVFESAMSALLDVRSV